jgi:putative transcriptional regulator
MDVTDDRLAPGFLVAPPPMGDPNFDHTVVLMAVHDEEHSLGFVVNRRSTVMLHALLKELDITPLTEDKPVLSGGPVGETTGFVLYEHAPQQPAGNGMQLAPGLSLSPSKEVLVSAVRGQLTGRFELILGYAGWGPGQLLEELRRGSWLHAGFDHAMLWDVAMENRWEEMFARLGINPMGFMNVPGGALA